MSDDETPPNGDVELPRRHFLKLGVTGAAGSRWFGDASAAEVPPGATGVPLGSDDGTDASTRQDDPDGPSLSPRAAVVSVRGLDAAGEFAVSSVASDHAVDRRPVSVRELVTPQPQIPIRLSEKTWNNWLEDYETSGYVLGVDLDGEGDAESRDVQRRQLLRVVANRATEAFRGVGSGHSHSEAAMPREGYNDLKNVKGELNQLDRWIKHSPPPYHDETDPIDTDHLVRLGAGTTIKYLNREVLPNKRPPLALPNMGSWDGQTLAGGINTSTHGTGIGLGTLADLVRSVEIAVAPEARTDAGEPHVRLLRVEPSDGITDPVAFARDTHRHDAALI